MDEIREELMKEGKALETGSTQCSSPSAALYFIDRFIDSLYFIDRLIDSLYFIDRLIDSLNFIDRFIDSLCFIDRFIDSLYFIYRFIDSLFFINLVHLSHKWKEYSSNPLSAIGSAWESLPS